MIGKLGTLKSDKVMSELTVDETGGLHSYADVLYITE